MINYQQNLKINLKKLTLKLLFQVFVKFSIKAYDLNNFDFINETIIRFLFG